MGRGEQHRASTTAAGLLFGARRGSRPSPWTRVPSSDSQQQIERLLGELEWGRDIKELCLVLRDYGDEDPDSAAAVLIAGVQTRVAVGAIALDQRRALLEVLASAASRGQQASLTKPLLDELSQQFFAGQGGPDEAEPLAQLAAANEGEVAQTLFDLARQASLARSAPEAMRSFLSALDRHQEPRAEELRRDLLDLQCLSWPTEDWGPEHLQRSFAGQSLPAALRQTLRQQPTHIARLLQPYPLTKLAAATPEAREQMRQELVAFAEGRMQALGPGVGMQAFCRDNGLEMPTPNECAEIEQEMQPLTGTFAEMVMSHPELLERVSLPQRHSSALAKALTPTVLADLDGCVARWSAQDKAAYAEKGALYRQIKAQRWLGRDRLLVDVIDEATVEAALKEGFYHVPDRCYRSTGDDRPLSPEAIDPFIKTFSPQRFLLELRMRLSDATI